MCKVLYLMCGPAGVGKTTWIMGRIAQSSRISIHISRDKIRFALLEDGDDYFSKEKEVVKKFKEYIKMSLEDENCEDIYVDATHLTAKSREDLLSQFNLQDTKVVAVNFISDLNKILEQNAQRSGRARVPDSVIRRMFYSYQPATDKEKYINEVIEEVR